MIWYCFWKKSEENTQKFSNNENILRFESNFLKFYGKFLKKFYKQILRCDILKKFYGNYEKIKFYEN